jgi:putative oxidoreductase
VAVAAVARFLISAIFLSSALKNVLNWHETEKNLMNVLCDWQMNIGYSEAVQDCLTFLTPWSPLLLAIATIFILVGGLLVLLGVREKLGAALLVLFMIPATVLYHPFWFLEGASRDLQTIMFLKNLAILGGLLLLVLHGGQAKSGGGGGGDSFPPLKIG